MAIFETTLVRREPVAEGTIAFHFAKPAGFTHRAGQSLLMTLIDPPQTDNEGNSRTFTIASAPFEADLMIATRMRDTAFKRVLKEAPLGIAVKIDGPDGEMVLHDDPARPAVFLAGGIGITPFLSMARQAAHEKLPHCFYPFYSNRRPEDAAFLAEFEHLQKINASFRLIATMTQAGKSARPWSGEKESIGRAMLERHLSDLASPVYYFAGPPAMAMAMHELLDEIGIGEDRMRYEEFYGY